MQLLHRFSRAARRALVASGAGLALLALPCPASAEAGAGSPGQAGQTVRIGMVNALTGSPSPLGRSVAESARAVFAEVNAQGGVHGRRLVLESLDDAYDPTQAVDRTLDLVQGDDVIALLNYVGTASTVAVLPILAQYGIPLVGPVSGAAVLRRPQQPLVFVRRASYAQEAEALVDRLVKEGSKTFGIVFQHDGFGHDVERYTEQALQRRGLTLQARGGYQRDTMALQQALQAMLAQRPDAVILAASTEPAFAFMQRARAAGLESQFASVSFIGLNPAVLARPGSAAENLLVTQVVPLLHGTETGIEGACRRALAAWGTEPLDFASFEGCINAWILVRALERAGPDPTRARLTKVLQSMSRLDLGGFDVSFAPGPGATEGEVYLTRVRLGALRPLP